MKKEVEIIKYNPNKGLQLSWENNYVINVKKVEGKVIITANCEGLVSLAKHLLTLAQEDVPIGSHIHLDQYNSLENDSVDLIIEKENYNNRVIK